MRGEGGGSLHGSSPPLAANPLVRLSVSSPPAPLPLARMLRCRRPAAAVAAADVTTLAPDRDPRYGGVGAATAAPAAAAPSALLVAAGSAGCSGSGALW